ncbi:MAG: hypothetical protein Q7S21_06965 [archaeon]|nr:hypothetical protein [archaeon]
MTIFVTRPEHDDMTFYLSTWIKLAMDFAESKGFKVIDFSKDRAIEKEVTKFLEKNNPKFVIFNGHGNDETIMGQKFETLIKSGKNEKLLKEKIVYAIACSAAAKLGNDCIKEGTTTFIGYDGLFSIIIENRHSSNPLKDEFVKPFFEASNELIKSIIKGNTTETAFLSSQRVFDEWIRKLQLTGVTPESSYMLRELIWDKIHQKILGKGDATLT